MSQMWIYSCGIMPGRIMRRICHMACQVPFSSSGATSRGINLARALWSDFQRALARATGVGHNTTSGLSALRLSLGFADDLVLTTELALCMPRLLEVVAAFVRGLVKGVKLSKSVITAYDFKQRCELPTDTSAWQTACCAVRSPCPAGWLLCSGGSLCGPVVHALQLLPTQIYGRDSSQSSKQITCFIPILVIN